MHDIGESIQAIFNFVAQIHWTEHLLDPLALAIFNHVARLYKDPDESTDSGESNNVAKILRKSPTLNDQRLRSRKLSSKVKDSKSS